MKILLFKMKFCTEMDLIARYENEQLFHRNLRMSCSRHNWTHKKDFWVSSIKLRYQNVWDILYIDGIFLVGVITPRPFETHFKVNWSKKINTKVSFFKRNFQFKQFHCWITFWRVELANLLWYCTHSILICWLQNICVLKCAEKFCCKIRDCCFESHWRVCQSIGKS